MKAKHSILITTLYSCLLLIGAIMAFLNLYMAPYVFATGVLLVVIEAFAQIYHLRNEDMRTKRLGRLRLVSALMLGFATYYMFIANNSWVVFLLIYAITTLFLSFRATPNK